MHTSEGAILGLIGGLTTTTKYNEADAIDCPLISALRWPSRPRLLDHAHIHAVLEFSVNLHPWLQEAAQKWGVCGATARQPPSRSLHGHRCVECRLSGPKLRTIASHDENDSAHGVVVFESSVLVVLGRRNSGRAGGSFVSCDRRRGPLPVAVDHAPHLCEGKMGRAANESRLYGRRPSSRR